MISGNMVHPCTGTTRDWTPCAKAICTLTGVHKKLAINISVLQYTFSTRPQIGKLVITKKITIADSCRSYDVLLIFQFEPSCTIQLMYTEGNPGQL